MVIPPKYRLTATMFSSFAKIEANKALFQQLDVPKQLFENIQRKSLLKSSLFSAKIEGNNLTLEQVELLTQDDEATKERLEIANILHALSFLQNNSSVSIDRDLILDIHKKVMSKLIDFQNLGRFRQEPSAIFNSSGFPVYIPPTPGDVPVLVEQLIQFINSDEEKNMPIKASMCHFIFERIHPFLDGNGRVGRLLFQLVLARDNYHFQWLLFVEEILNQRKAEYYSYLDTSDPTGFIEFMLEVLATVSEQIIAQLSFKKIAKEDTLLPRRKELVLLIREHQMLSLDMIKRRFFKIPERTLRYDLKQLEKQGYIVKVGTTRGAMYKST